MSFQKLKDADPSAYDDIAKSWERLASQLSHTGDDIKSTLGKIDGWQGEGADAALAHFKDVRSGYEDAAEYIEKISPALRTLSDEITDAQAIINDVIDTVDSNRYLHIQSDTGEVDTASGVAPGDRRSDDEIEEDRSTAQDLTGRIKKALRDATDADEVAKSALDKTSPSGAGLDLEAAGPENTVTAGDIPGEDASPKEVHKWWNSLNPMQQESAIYTHGDKIGGMDGVPVEARDRANQPKFAEKHADVKTQVAELEAAGNDRGPRYEDLKDRLRGMDAIDKRLEQASNGKQPQSYLLGFSAKGNGRGIVATGNPDTADNVVTSVPGTESDLGGIGGDLEHSERILQRANERSPDADTAAVTWVGYDAPPGIPEASTTGYADDAADDLRNFQDGLRATHEGDESNNTVIGHSYGSTVIGHAAQGENTQLDVDNAVFIGSPGVGVDHASDLQLPGDAEVYASTAENDIIQRTPASIHGQQPINDDFGAHTFESDPGTDGEWYTTGVSTDAHSEYWERGSESLRNMGMIVVGGQPD